MVCPQKKKKQTNISIQLINLIFASIIDFHFFCTHYKSYLHRFIEFYLAKWKWFYTEYGNDFKYIWIFSLDPIVIVTNEYSFNLKFSKHLCFNQFLEVIYLHIKWYKIKKKQKTKQSEYLEIRHCACHIFNV